MLASYISKELGRPILYIRPHIDDADKAADDMRSFGAGNVEAFGAWEGEEEIADAINYALADGRREVAEQLAALLGEGGE